MSFIDNMFSLLDVIEEKDNRGKILKMGLPQDVADYLHGVHDKYSLWFADQIKKSPAYHQANNKLNFVNNLRTQMQGIIDWVSNTPNVILKQYTWDTALAAAHQYHHNLVAANIEGIETNTIIKKYNDGFYWVDLESTRDRCEASAMGHCATTHNADTLYSLRKFEQATNTIEPFITLAISPDEGKWVQCKGKNNSKPKPVYHPYIADILVSSNALTYKSEYDSANDFTDATLISYIEDNKKEFENADDILEKISANRVSVKQFHDILKNYSFTSYNMDIYEDDDYDNVNVLYSFYIDIPYKDTGLDKQTIDDNFSINYRSKARKYLNDVLSVWASDVEVEAQGDDYFTIRCDLEDDINYDLSDIGLRSFEQQCEHYDELNKRFDKDEFIKEVLPKLLILDEVMESPYLDFIENIKQIEDVNVEQHRTTLDSHVKIGKTMISYLDEHKLSYFSNLRRTSFDYPIDRQSLATQKAKTTYNDIILYDIFWAFIKKHVLDNASQVKVNTLNVTDKFQFVIDYEYDKEDDYNFDEELQLINKILQQLPAITKYLKEFEDKVVTPFISSGEPVTVDTIEIEGDITRSKVDILSKNVYIGTHWFSADADNITGRKEELDRYIDKKLHDLLTNKNRVYHYRDINERKIINFLEELITHQMSFKDFFEGYSILNKVI